MGRERCWSRTCLALGTIVLFVAPFAVSRDASAHGFGSGPGHYISYTSFVTYGSSESNGNHRAILAAFWGWVMNYQYGPRTAVAVDKVPSQNAYVYWFVTPLPSGVGADARCMEYTNVSSNPAECSRARVRHNESGINRGSKSAKRQGVCHEVGHTLGFIDYPGGSTNGCMGGGTANGGVLRTHEINHLNACYGSNDC